MRWSSCTRVFVVVSAVFLLFSLIGFAGAQGLPQASGVGDPANDCGCPSENDSIPVSSGMLAPLLPKIPNLELGFLYSFGKNVRTGRFTADYVLPVRLSADSVLFGEAHAEGWDFWRKGGGTAIVAPGIAETTSPTSNRVDLSFGGGYRTMLGSNTFVGVNGFYDTSRLFNQWYSSGGVGLEYAANVGSNDAVDLNFNWYGNLFNRDVLVNAFRNKGNSFDVEAGYSHALFNQSMDLRLKLIGYQFGVGEAVYGWRGGADLTTRDGMFTLRYEHGSDRLNGDYNTVGGFVTVGFQLENLLSGESPFTMPEPVFRSPRDLRRLLGLKVKRNWHQPAAVVQARSNPTCPNLVGSVLYATRLEIGDITTTPYPTAPPIPNLTAAGYNVRICWCGLQTLGNRHFVVYTGSMSYDTSTIPMDTETGCFDDILVLNGPRVKPNGVINDTAVTLFRAGGGISFYFTPL